MKKTLSLVLALVLLVIPTLAMAEEAVEKPEVQEIFRLIKGQVVDVEIGEDLTRVRINYLVEDEKIEADIIINSKTYLVQEDLFKEDNKEELVGKEFFAYYELNKPSINIYPPQYKAVIGGLVEENKLIPILTRFDENLLAVDNSLKINSLEGVKIINIAGEKYEKDIVGKDVVVFYSKATKSLPPQTTPDKIVVYSAIEPREVEDTEEVMDIDYSKLTYMVANKEIKAAKAFETKDKVVMVPLRALAEGLGYEVKWDSVARAVRVGLDSTLTVGKDNYTFARMAPIKLGQEPIIKDGLTYVPLSYFTEVLKLNNAYVFEGQIVINNEEKMQ